MRILLLAAALAWSLPAIAEEAGFTLPTPYTAAQIRDSFRLGLTIVVRTTGETHESFTRHAVTGWSEDAMMLTSTPVDAAGEPVGESRTMNAKWTDLLEHARFSADGARRRRARQVTPLGRLPGWLYRVRQDDGNTAVYFFPDSTPGMPVVFGQKRGTQWITRNEQISREVR